MVVTGATGMQGSGVIDALSANPDWRIRGLTRDTNSEKAKALVHRGIEMVAATFDDEDSLKNAFIGVNAILQLPTSTNPALQGSVQKRPCKSSMTEA